MNITLSQPNTRSDLIMRVEILRIICIALGVITCTGYVCNVASSRQATSLGAGKDGGLPSTHVSRHRNSLSRAVLLGVGLLPSLIMPGSSSAKVYFDLDTYGDKELKIATVNKIKQKLRNLILQNIALAPVLFQLAISDAIGYDMKTEEGGPDASIKFEIDQSNTEFVDALAAIELIKKDLSRTNSVSSSDLISFGGGEVLESVGGSRTTVQVGRYDAKKENDRICSNNWSENNKCVIDAFYNSGMEAQDIALILGSLGEIKRIVAETIEENKKGKGNDDDDDDEDADDSWQNNVPSTFGERSQIYGKRVGKADFGNKYLSQLVKGSTSDNLGKLLLADPKVKLYVQKYATNEVQFKADVPAAYNKLTTLGQAFITRNS